MDFGRGVRMTADNSSRA